MSTGVLVAKTVCESSKPTDLLWPWPDGHVIKRALLKQAYSPGDQKELHLETGRKPDQRGTRLRYLRTSPSGTSTWFLCRTITLFTTYTSQKHITAAREQNLHLWMNLFHRHYFGGSFILIPEIPWQCLQFSGQILLTIFSGGKCRFFESRCYFKK